MIKLMSEGVARAADVKDGRAVWIYLNELPPRQMIEFGHVLPEPGTSQPGQPRSRKRIAPSCNGCFSQPRPRDVVCLM